MQCTVHNWTPHILLNASQFISIRGCVPWFLYVFNILKFSNIASLFPTAPATSQQFTAQQHSNLHSIRSMLRTQIFFPRREGGCWVGSPWLDVGLFQIICNTRSLCSSTNCGSLCIIQKLQAKQSMVLTTKWAITTTLLSGQTTNMSKGQRQ